MKIYNANHKERIDIRYLSNAAIVKAKEAHHKIILIDGSKLTDLMFEFGVGVQTTNTYEMKEVDEDFFECSQ